jgi:hypothetical protein
MTSFTSSEDGMNHPKYITGIADYIKTADEMCLGTRGALRKARIVEYEPFIAVFGPDKEGIHSIAFIPLGEFRLGADQVRAKQILRYAVGKAILKGIQPMATVICTEAYVIEATNPTEEYLDRTHQMASERKLSSHPDAKDRLVYVAEMRNGSVILNAIGWRDCCHEKKELGELIIKDGPEIDASGEYTGVLPTSLPGMN